LGCSLLTKKKFSKLAEVEWSLISPQWQRFLKACLEEVPGNRPADFLELEDWLLQPEVGLTTLDGVDEVLDFVPHNLSVVEPVEVPFKFVSPVIKSTTVSLTPQQQALLKGFLEAGNKAIKNAKWKEAKKALKEALKVDSGHIEAHVAMAIVCYELEDFKESEKCYEYAKQVDARLAKRFREHIAFKI
jgi:tetratricopeptide (TPR) repeat protein